MRAKPSRPPVADELTDAALGLSRALVGIALRSVSEQSDDLTLVQFRALATLSDHGSQRVADLAARLGVNSSTATRTATRLLRKGLIVRASDSTDHRATLLEITDDGRSVARAVTTRRQAAIARIVRRIPAERRDLMVEAMQAFTAAAGEGPEQDWTPGWTG
ncbi:MAG TPA: MarR family transcriptional regulator [Mycobacteriales bacterium]|nr:MarR family transcriptional regulator [Mycobacteriales bacterium]